MAANDQEHDATKQVAWRLSLLWGETVLDQVTVEPGTREQTVTLRTGDVVRVNVEDDLLAVRGDKLEARLHDGQRVLLPAGHVLLAEIPIARAKAVATDLTVDTTFLHSGMIAIAMTVCAVSALWLHPSTITSDGGGGIPKDAHRFLSVSGGVAPTVGKPTVALTGRPIELGERFELRQEQGAQQRPKSPSTARNSLEAALTAVSMALRKGNDAPVSQRDALGEAVRRVAQAPVLGAGVGGLSPRDRTDDGKSTGTIDIGELSREQAIRRQQAREQRDALSSLPPKQNHQLSADDGDVDNAGRIDAKPELDPMVREHLTRMIRTRHNLVRGCYEAWGLAGNSHAQGRLILELTLRPDGRIERPTTSVSHDGLKKVGACIERTASEWYLGDGLVDEPTRLAFPFNLQPRSP